MMNTAPKLFDGLSQWLRNERDEEEQQQASKAVISMCDGRGAVLWYCGPDIAAQIEEAGLNTPEDLGLDGGPDGISIWEGSWFGYRDYWSGEYDGELKGAFRAPNAREWECIRQGINPFGDEAPVLAERPMITKFYRVMTDLYAKVLARVDNESGWHIDAPSDVVLGLTPDKARDLEERMRAAYRILTKEST